MTIKESRFTAPRPDCPNPEYWHSADSDSTEREVSLLVGSFIRALQPEFCVETGTAFGLTAQEIGHNLKVNGHGNLVTLEINAKRVQIAKHECHEFPVKVKQISSLDYEPEQAIDFIWIDSHQDLRAKEIKYFQRWASPRCVVGIHDTGPQHKMRAQVDSLSRENIIQRPLYLPTPRGVAFVRYKDGILA